jgi:two-component system cell cycle response regulator CpdR
LLVACLTSDGHSVVEATNGHQALEKLGSGQFDILLTDLAMPGMDGASLAQAVKQAAPDTPIVLLSGFTEQFEASANRPSALDLILSKPVELEQLRQALAQVTATKSV